MAELSASERRRQRILAGGQSRLDALSQITHPSVDAHSTSAVSLAPTQTPLIISEASLYAAAPTPAHRVISSAELRKRAAAVKPPRTSQATIRKQGHARFLKEAQSSASELGLIVLAAVLSALAELQLLHAVGLFIFTSVGVRMVIYKQRSALFLMLPVLQDVSVFAVVFVCVLWTLHGGDLPEKYQRVVLPDIVDDGVQDSAADVLGHADVVEPETEPAIDGEWDDDL